MNSVSHPEDVVKTCEDCAYGEYHRAQIGDLERPPEAAYYECHHPRVCRPAPYDPSTPPDDFRCRYWLCAGSDAAAMDAEVMSFAEWREIWRVDWLTGELVTL